MSELEFKGTKGKWLIDDQPIWVMDEEGNDIETESIANEFNEEVCLVSYYNSTIEEGNANAKLIAAAPNLLEALQDLTFRIAEQLEHGQIQINKHHVERCMDASKKAIEKALK